MRNQTKVGGPLADLGSGCVGCNRDDVEMIGKRHCKTCWLDGAAR